MLLAFSAYARGDGPLAGVSLEAALRCEPHPSNGSLRHRAQPDASNRSVSWPSRDTGWPIGSACGRRRGGPSVSAGSPPNLLDLDRVGHVVGQLNLLMAGNHDVDPAVVVGLDGHPRVGTTPASLSRAIRPRRPGRVRSAGAPRPRPALPAGSSVSRKRRPSAPRPVLPTPSRTGRDDCRTGGGRVVEHLNQSRSTSSLITCPSDSLGVHFLPRQPEITSTSSRSASRCLRITATARARPFSVSSRWRSPAT